MRRALVGLSVLVGVLVLGIAAARAGGGFLGGPGDSDYASSDALSFFGDSGQSIQVRRSTFVFQPLDGAPYEEAATLLMVFSKWGFSCYRIPDEDFVISPDLASARLQTTVSGPNNCGKSVFPATAGGPAGPMFGDGVALAEPVQLDIEWASIGAVSTFTSTYGTACLDFMATTDATGESVSARARGRIASASRFATAPRTIASFARLGTSRAHNSVNSEFPFACT